MRDAEPTDLPAETSVTAALETAAMRSGDPVVLALSNLAATEALGTILGERLGPGDTVLLSGPLGAGKSALARQILRTALADPDLEVPSPSYTLVNVYEPVAGPALWHADLYRLGDPSELHELGLEDAFATAVVLIEWPERLTSRPARRMEIALSVPLDGPEAPSDQADEPREATLRAFGAWPTLRAAS
ncbi:MAG: tRNA (adenosine(37)-N6)-threonylcarbamoyltransferase complex ATPase subunit type 1 TsaE [Pseudomonadota bacterium]